MHLRKIITLLAALLLCATGAGAKKRSQVETIYIFGMAASFQDTIVHFTTVQEVEGAWVDDKTRFLLAREEYSYQLRNYLNEQLSMPQRTCIVVYDKSRKKAEKKQERMMRLYTQPPKGARQYDVRHIGQADFAFHPVDMSATISQQQQEQEEQKAAAKKKPKKEKKKKGKEEKVDVMTGAPAPVEERRPPHND